MFAGTVTVIASIIQMSFIEWNENVVYIAAFAGTVVGTFLAIDFLLTYEESIVKKMIRNIRRVIRGCGNVPGYGYHPGTPLILLHVFAVFILGTLHRDLEYGLLLAGVGLVALVPVYIWGAYERAKLGEKDFISGLTDDHS